MTCLLLTVRWLDDRYHGLLDRNGTPEWPPSPYRLFQALIAGVARRGELESEVGQSLAWLQSLDPPMIVAPPSLPGQVVTRFVPNNDGDKKPDRQTRLKGKTSHPTLMFERSEIRYFWTIDDHDSSRASLVGQAARYLTSLGWGIDLAYADGRAIGDDEIAQSPGIRWCPRKGVMRDDGRLRVPIIDAEMNVDSLSDLKRAHKSRLDRIGQDRPLNTVERPTVFDRVFYESSERLLMRPYVVFELRRDDGTFDAYPQEKLIHIAGMVRHLAIESMRKSPPEDVTDGWLETYVAGHVRAGAIGHRQLSFLPMPSIGHAQTDPSVRRIMIAAPPGDDKHLQDLAMRLGGQQLVPTRETKLAHPPTLVRVRDDKVARLYTRPANAWATVTPVILPGHDDHRPAKTRQLIEKALTQSAVEQPCEYEWSPISHFPKSCSAHKYDRDRRPTGYIRPDHLLTQTAVHLRLRFSGGLEVPGPLAIGAGRHCGLGLMARVDP
jgi:CRISPR-associated protein Csb2